MNKNFSASRKGTSPSRLFTFVLVEGIGVVIAISRNYLPAVIARRQ